MKKLFLTLILLSGQILLAQDLNSLTNEWKIEQYHLSVTVPNGAIKNFIDLVKNYEQNQLKK